MRNLARVLTICGCLAVWAAAHGLDAPPEPEGTGWQGRDIPPDLARVIERGRLIVALRPDLGKPLCYRSEDDRLMSILEVCAAAALVAVVAPAEEPKKRIKG